MSAVELLEIELRVGGETLPAALALPSGERPRPGVLVLHELWGLTDDIRAHARRLAGAGYVALAPELYGPGGRRVCIARAVRDLRGGGELGLGRSAAALRELGRLPEVEAGRVGAIGFCLGGGFALLLGAREPAGAVAINYGRVPERRDEIEGVCPVVASYGGRDRQLRGHPERLERFLAELGVPHDVKTYPEGGHSFLNRSVPPALVRALRPLAVVGYRPDEAEDAWRRILAFFGAHLDAPVRRDCSGETALPRRRLAAPDARTHGPRPDRRPARHGLHLADPAHHTGAPTMSTSAPLFALPRRPGPRPRTTPTNPHQQLDQHPNEAVIERLAGRLFSLPGVVEAPSMVSVPGARALLLIDGPVNPRATMAGREFAHLHPLPDGSLHVSLPPARAREAIEAGWAELHPLAGLFHSGLVMLYAPRDDEETDVVLTLVRDALAFARGA